MHFTTSGVSARQDGLLTRRQALEVMTEDELASRLGRYWAVILPGIYSTSTGPLTERQRTRAALLHAGSDALIADDSVLRLLRTPYLPVDDIVRILVPASTKRVSRDFVSITRTTRMPQPRTLDGLPAAPTPRALCQFVLRHPDERECLAVAAAVVQAGHVTVEQLLSEAQHGPARGRPRLMRVLEALQAGVRSAPEGDFRLLVRRSRILPEPRWNPTVVLSDGQRLKPDALFEDAGLVHETNGRDVHAGFDAFEHMQRRHDQLTSAGFTVLHNSPRRIDLEGPSVLAEVERCYTRFAGRGMPPGVRILP